MSESLATYNWQAALTWTLAFGIVCTVVTQYTLRYLRRHKQSVKRLQEARDLGLDKAQSQYPHIDTSLCIGCGSCVKACPEYDVLAVIHGVSVVVNGKRCIGHAKCEEVCPVGALKVSLGDVSDREDIPLLTEYQETTVPGIYIAGELSGISLIRNAITQGRKVVEHIATTLDPNRDRKQTDVIIVGAGPSGLTGALAAIEKELTHVVLERSEVGGTIAHYPKRKLVMTQPIPIPLYGRLKRSEYQKEDLLEIWEEATRKFGVDIRSGQELTEVRQADGGFFVKTNNGEFFGRNIVLCLGRRGTPRKLGAPGEELSKVVYKLVDAQTYAGRNVLVVGGGDSAVEAAIALGRQPGTELTISYRKRGFPRIKKKNEERINEAIESGIVKALFESNVQAISESDVELSTPDGLVTIPNDDVIILVGGIPPFKMLQQMGIRFGGSEPEPAVEAPAREAAEHVTVAELVRVGSP